MIDLLSPHRYQNDSRGGRGSDKEFLLSAWTRLEREGKYVLVLDLQLLRYNVQDAVRELYESKDVHHVNLDHVHVHVLCRLLQNIHAPSNLTVLRFGLIATHH